MAFSGTQQKCKACDKTVYLVEQLTADGVVYHKSCFRCNHCKGTLKLANYASLDGVLYCKPHFEQLLKLTGSFDKSFEQKGVDGLKKQGSEKSETKTPSKASLMFSGTQDKCIACNKTVYPIEKTTVEGLPYHKNCFKCVHGGCTISPSNYAALEGRLYCKHHYSQLFKEKGNYSQLTKAEAYRSVSSAIYGMFLTALFLPVSPYHWCSPYEYVVLEGLTPHEHVGPQTSEGLHCMYQRHLLLFEQVLNSKAQENLKKKAPTPERSKLWPHRWGEVQISQYMSYLSFTDYTGVVKSQLL